MFVTAERLRPGPRAQSLIFVSLRLAPPAARVESANGSE